MSDLADWLAARERRPHLTKEQRVGALKQFNRALNAEAVGAETIDVPIDWILAVVDEVFRRRDAMDDHIASVREVGLSDSDELTANDAMCWVKGWNDCRAALLKDWPL